MPYNKEDLRYFENKDVASPEFKEYLVEISNSNGDFNSKIHDLVRALMCIAQSFSPDE